jgi:tetratricopeptide (TPR) repeat protein
LAGVIEESGGAGNADVYRQAVDAELAASEHVDYLHILPQTLERIAEAQAAARKFDDALATAGRIGESTAGFREKRGFALARIAQRQAEAGDIAGATATLQETLKLVERTTDKRPYEGILLQVMDAQAALADVEGVRMTAERLGDRYRMIGLIGMYRAYVNAHDNDSAKAMLDSALQLAEATSGTTEGADNLGSVASLMAKAGDVESARRVFEKSLAAAAAIEDVREHAVALARLARAMKVAGDEDSARKAIEPLRELIETHGDARRNPVLLASMAADPAQLGDVTTAMTLTAQIGDIDQRTRALVEIAATLPN